MSNEIVFDIEANGLEDASIIHVVSANFNGGIKSTKVREKVVEIFSNKDNIVIAHNSKRYDIPTLERIYGFKCKARVVDTLALSWYLYPERVRHGLEWWGEEFGVPKPVVTDWQGLSYGEYKHRCEEDVRINTLLWEQIKKHLLELYGSEEGMWALIDYLMFKMDCAVEQERSRWRLDKAKALALQEHLQEALSEAHTELQKVMPDVPIMTTKECPAKPYKRNGSLSVHGERWVALLKEHNKHPDTKKITYISGYNKANPQSDPQIKAWLFGLGWQPCTFKYKRNKETNEVREIPQVRTKDGDNNAILTPSVERLAEDVPEVGALQQVGVVKHRLDVVNGFITNERDGFVRARIKGLTNTLRFQHTEVVNLPGIDKPYGKDLRGCLIAREGYELCGSDMCSLEDRTKQHYMWPHDPDYVKEMMTDDFDPHIDLCVVGGFMSKAEAKGFKMKTLSASIMKTLGAVRKRGKAANYACVYGAKGATVARSAGISKKEGDKLVDAYWVRNWSVKVIAEEQTVRTVRGQMWLLNPVSKLWYPLRYDKDRFSTLNQGTGTYCFDMWVKKIMSKRKQLNGQFHDEVVLEIKKGYREQAVKLLKWAIKEVNSSLKLNRELDVDVQFGGNYAEIH